MLLENLTSAPIGGKIMENGQSSEFAPRAIFRALLLLLEKFFGNFSDRVGGYLGKAIRLLERIFELGCGGDGFLDIKLVVIQVLISILKFWNRDQDSDLEGGANIKDNDSDFEDLGDDDNLQLAKKTSQVSNNNLSQNPHVDGLGSGPFSEQAVTVLIKKFLKRITVVPGFLGDHGLVETLCGLIMEIPRFSGSFFEKFESDAPGLTDLPRNEEFFGICRVILTKVKLNKTKLRLLEYIISDFDVASGDYNGFMADFLEIGKVKSIESDFFYSIAAIFNARNVQVDCLGDAVLAKLILRAFDGFTSKNKKITCNSIRILGLIFSKTGFQRLYGVLAEVLALSNEPVSENFKWTCQLIDQTFFTNFFDQFKEFLGHSFSKFGWNATFAFSLILRNINTCQVSIFHLTTTGFSELNRQSGRK
jgi:hypothetical protein